MCQPGWGWWARGLVFYCGWVSWLSAQSAVTIDESRLRAELRADSTVIVLPVANTSGRPLEALLALDWLTPSATPAQTVKFQPITLPPGAKELEFPLPLSASSPWLRLRYQLTPVAAEARTFFPISRILPLSRIMKDLFQLDAVLSGQPQPGHPLTIRVAATHPLTQAPVLPKSWTAVLNVNGAEVKPLRRQQEGPGLTTFVFPFPVLNQQQESGAEIEIEAALGEYRQDLSLEIQLPTNFTATVQTDKPIYQPEQTLHLRTVCLDPARRAAAGERLLFRINDPDGQRVHTAARTASAFGIAHDDWAFPASSPLGVYQIQIVREKDESVLASHAVRLSRYELPVFQVAVKPGRPAYRNGDTATVTVSATSLAGKPVPNGEVRITEIDGDQPLAQGRADSQGVFVAQLPIAADFVSSGSLYRDRPLAAYYRDPLTQRTEQRRFDLRITRDLLHLYTVNTDRALYLATLRADGTPLAASVDVHACGQTLSVSTNRLGVAKLASPVNCTSIEFNARTSAGETGRTTAYASGPAGELVLDPGKTLHRAGDGLSVTLTAPDTWKANRHVVVEAIAGGVTVASQIVRLAGRRGQVTFPPHPGFRGAVYLFAWSAEDTASRAVIFPDGSDLRLTASTPRPEYQPGQRAPLTVRVSAADGRPVSAALGVAVVDQAVLERARTDEDFGRRPYFICSFCAQAGEEEFAGQRLNDLYLHRGALTPERDLVAEALAAKLTLRLPRATSAAGAPQFTQITAAAKAMREALEHHYDRTLELPDTFDALQQVPRWPRELDPWERPYRYNFQVEQDARAIDILSDGPDHQPGTTDDLAVATIRRPYFLPISTEIKRILRDADPFPTQLDSFLDLLRSRGIVLTALRDPLGHPYQARLTVSGTLSLITVWSAGPDGIHRTNDDVVVGHFSGEYFSRRQQEIQSALSRLAAPPTSPEAFVAALMRSGIDFAALRDPWQHPYRVTSGTATDYADRLTRRRTRIYGSTPTTKTTVTPVTRKLLLLRVLSPGPDGLPDTPGDVTVAVFPTLLDEQDGAVRSAANHAPVTGALGTGALGTGALGTVAGTVLDNSGAAIPGVEVRLRLSATIVAAGRTDLGGRFELQAPAGFYTLSATAAGFVQEEVEFVPVVARQPTTVDLQLEVGSIAQMLAVTASAPTLMTQASMTVAAAPGSTPRVRDYFPETLLWLPEVPTDVAGRAQLDVPLADSVTTWKVALFASTADGRAAQAEHEIKAFQPFFLEVNPPAILTQGDRLDLPVTVRNYLSRTQDIKVQLADGPARSLTLGPHQSANTLFPLEATPPIGEVRQRFIATSKQSAGDALEKSTQVHPDGQEVVRTFAEAAPGAASFRFDLPSQAIPGSASGELRLYPNVASLLLESAGSLTRIPHGCAEQTISAAYANLIAWRFAQTSGVNNAAIETAALQHVRLALESLAARQSSDGGLPYWAASQPDIAVTAYALQFAADAAGVTELDRETWTKSIRWLEQQQQPTGLWSPRQNEAGSLMLTGLVTRALAAARQAGLPVPDAVLAKAYSRLTRFTDTIDEPYVLAHLVHAALDAKDEAVIATAVSRLLAMAREENGERYWDLQTNMPFYGWGTPGRYETSGVVLTALARYRRLHPAAELDQAISRGLAFLLRARRAQGDWFSTQATLRAMQALVDSGLQLGDPGTIQIKAAGRLVRTVTVSAGPSQVDPVRVDVPLAAGANEVTVSSDGGLLARLAAKHWVPWTAASLRASTDLKIDVHYHRTTLAIGEPVTCRVRAERVGFRGYGMMLAEIGLPPGAEVDRASLQTLLNDVPGVDHYELLPDRLVLYLWPRAGGVDFTFAFRPRFAMSAQSAPSLLYDYYNPPERVDVAPTAFTVR